MGTRSRIAIRNADSSYDSIYCHWDGYPDGVGTTLRDHYKTEDKIRALIALGDISSLGEELGEKHDFDSRDHEGWTTAYGRDRGEEGCPSERSADLDELGKLTQNCGGEWLYIWNGNEWTAAEGGIAFFGMPADKAPEGLESIEYWLQRDAQE